MSATLSIEDLCVELGSSRVLDHINLELAAGSYGVVLGPSGAGKSTLLRSIAGLCDASGQIRVGERSLCAGQQVVPPEERGVGFLFQDLALWPHMTVRAHLEYALGRGGDATRISEMLQALGLDGLDDRVPARLSGGERQRLALARALITSPSILLLDEPTSSVDPTTRRAVQQLLSDVATQFGSTVLHVTHDQDEAMRMADRLLILVNGRILQAGTPEEVYQTPAQPAVARFLGVGTLVPITVREGGRASSQVGTFPIDGDVAPGPAWALLRPSMLALVGEGDGVPGVVESCSFLGEEYEAQVRVADLHLRVTTPRRCSGGDAVRVSVVGTPFALPGENQQ